MSTVWRWVPGKSIGPFVFGDLIAPYIQEYELRKRCAPSPIVDWDTYELPGFESWISTIDGRINSVHCEDAVIYNDTDLLGLPVTEVREVLGQEDKKENDVGLGYAIYYDRLGITLFIVADRVDAAACNAILTD